MAQLVLDRRGRVVGVVGQFENGFGAGMQQVNRLVDQGGYQGVQAPPNQQPVWDQFGSLTGPQQSANPTIMEEADSNGGAMGPPDMGPGAVAPAQQWNPNQFGSNANLMPTMTQQQLAEMQTRARAARAARLQLQPVPATKWSRNTKAAVTGLGTGAIAGVAAALIAPVGKLGWGLGIGLLGVLVGGGVGYMMSPVDEF